jgi:signal peptidase II
MRATLATALAIFAADQVSKWFVVIHLDLARLGAIDVLPPYLNLRMAWNTGVNFGLLAADSQVTRWALIAVALAICAGVMVWLQRSRPPLIARLAGGVLLGGALGNVIDRVIYGAVADFLNMSCCGISNPFSFNIADIAIFAGALGLAFFADAKPAPTKTP